MQYEHNNDNHERNNAVRAIGSDKPYKLIRHNIQTYSKSVATQRTPTRVVEKIKPQIVRMSNIKTENLRIRP